MLLVDQGKASHEIDQAMQAEKLYKSLIVTTLPQLLGGRWDVKAPGTPVGDYWTKLYLLRNRVVHGGYEPSSEDARQAHEVHGGLREYVKERLWERRRRFPRTLISLVARDEFVRRGWRDPWLDERVAEMSTEPAPHWLPADQAGRRSGTN
jgi:hypothetical protein